MNHVYRLIWSETAAAFVAVSEISRARGRRSSKSMKAASALLLAMVAGTGQAGVNLPTGLTNGIVDGKTNVCPTGCATTSADGKVMTITNPGGSFYVEATGGVGVGKGYRLDIEQARTSFALLKDTSGVKGTIDGLVNSQGRVVIVNQEGILIGRDATIDVGSLVLSAQPISRDNFLSGLETGSFLFTNAAAGVSIINEGMIKARGDSNGLGGVVAILAPNIINKGVILVPHGDATLFAGSEVAVDLQTNLVSLGDSAGTSAVIDNQGLIRARNIWARATVDGRNPAALGKVLVNNDGVLEANQLSQGEAGTIILETRPLSRTSESVGSVQVGGSLVAESKLQGSPGKITVGGNSIDMHGHTSSDNLRLEAFGKNGANVTFSQGVKLDVKSVFEIKGQGPFTVINDLNELSAIGSSGNYFIGNDIDASSTAVNAFKPLAGGQELGFSGTLLGGGHVIDALHIDTSGTVGNTGLFSSIFAARIANLGLSNVSVVGNQGATGALAGVAGMSNVKSVWASGQVSGLNGSVGGLIGSQFLGTLDTAYFTGDVLVRSGALAASLGGLVGNAQFASITNAYASGRLIDQGFASHVGGLVGSGVGSTIASVYADEKITLGANASVGGLIGAGNDSVGGEVGDSLPGGSTVGYFRRDDSLTYTDQRGTGLSDAEMTSGAAFAGFDADKTWRTYEGHTSPLLQFWLKPITLDVANVSKTYDGDTASALQFQYTVAERYMPYETGTAPAWLAADASLRHGLMVTDPTRDAAAAAQIHGAWSAVHVADSGQKVQLWSDQQGYDLSALNGQLTITPKLVTITASAVSKVYDGSSALAPAAYADKLAFNSGQLIKGDVLTISVNSAALNSKNVTEATTAQYQVSLGGASQADYTVAQTVSGQGSITAKQLTTTAQAVTKVYDGTTSASAAALGLTITSGQVIEGDQVTVTAGAASFNDKNVVGANQVNFTATLDGQAKSNYALAANSPTSVAGSITAKQLTTTAQAVTKVYDGTTSADAAALGLAITSGQVIEGDQVTVTAGAASFNDKNVVGANQVNFTATLDGQAKSNYALAANSPTSVAGSITAKQLTTTAQAVTKVYDGTTSASAAALGLTITSGQVIEGDQVTVTAGAASFNDKNVVGANQVNFTATLDGQAKSNYALAANSPTSVAGSITAKQLTTTAQAVTKVYDGTTSADAAALGLTITSGQVIEGDQVTVTAGAASFNDKNVVGANQVNFTATLDGQAKSNYALAANSPTSVAGSITAKQLTTTAQSVTKVYDGTTSASAAALGLAITSGQVIEGDQVTVTAGAASFNDKNVVGANQVNFTATLDGQAKSNYALAANSPTSVAGSITAKQLTTTAQAVTKVYDGTTSADAAALGLAITSGQVIANDNVTVTASNAAFNSKDVETANKVSFTTTLGGQDQSNYALSDSALTSVAGTITPKPVTPVDPGPQVPPTQPPVTQPPTNTGDIVGNVPNGTNTTPINTNLLALGDLLNQLPPTAAGEEEDEEKRKARFRKDRSPLRVMDGGVKVQAPATPSTQP